MPKYKVTLSYDGTIYGSQQRQTDTHSIQQEIEAAVEKTEDNFIRITASGRTDTHVHTLGQAFHFDSTKDLTPENWRHTLNSPLPHDIRIQDVCFVEDGSYTRFHAISKRYDYLTMTDMNSLFYYRYMGKDRRVLDVKRMSEYVGVFLGTHGFTSFTSSKLDPRKPKAKTITRPDIVQEEHIVHLVFEGNRFLRYMVRMIVQTLTETDKYRLDVVDVKQMLYGQDEHLRRYETQAEGLCLIHVTYVGTKKAEEQVQDNLLSVGRSPICRCSQKYAPPSHACKM